MKISPGGLSTQPDRSGIHNASMKSKKDISIILIAVLTTLTWACRKEFVPDEPKYNYDDVNPDATPYTLNIPPFFAPMDVPENNPLTEELVELGRHLFWDVRLSGDNSQSCATCHIPEASFSDPNQFSVGINGELGNRQAMACVNLGWHPNFFWDGRSPTLEEQVTEPVENPIEMDENWDDLLVELSLTDLYPPMYAAAFTSDEITKERSAKALAAFLRTMMSGNSKFDRERLGQYTYTEEEARGKDLFLKEGGDPENGQGGQWGADCFHCHGFGAGLFTDNLMHNNGLDSVFTDLGLGEVTGNPEDFGKFKTPTLRNIELTAPYMHDGRFETLEEVIDHYNSGGHPSSTIDPFMKYSDGGLQLSEQSKADLKAFLLCLTDEDFTTNEAFSNPFE